MAKLNLASLINPHPCNPAQEDRNWAALNQIMQILNEIIEINIDETTNEYTYNLININEITAVQIDVTNIDVTEEINATTINVTYVYATEVNSSFVTSYNVTYEVLYDGDTEVCPEACGSGSGGGGSGGSGGSSCTFAEVVDNLPSTLDVDVAWGGGTTTITVTKYSEVLSGSGGGYAEKRYAGSGTITGGSTLQIKVWVYKLCNGTPMEVSVINDLCSGAFMSSLTDRSQWSVMVVASESPLSSSFLETNSAFITNCGGGGGDTDALFTVTQ